MDRCRTQGGGTRPNPINQDQHMVRIGPAHENVRRLAQATIIADVEAGNAQQRPLHRQNLLFFNIVASNDADRGQAFVSRLRGSGGGDDNRWQRFGFRQGSACQDQQD